MASCWSQLARPVRTARARAPSTYSLKPEPRGRTVSADTPSTGSQVPSPVTSAARKDTSGASARSRALSSSQDVGEGRWKFRPAMRPDPSTATSISQVRLPPVTTALALLPDSRYETSSNPAGPATLVRMGFKPSSGMALRRLGEKCWAASAPESGRRWEASRSQDTCLPTGVSGTATPGADKAGPTVVVRRTNPTSPIRTLRTSVLLRRLARGQANTPYGAWLGTLPPRVARPPILARFAIRRARRPCRTPSRPP